MKSITRIKNLLWDNDVALSMDRGIITAVITNRNSGNSHLVSGKNLTEISTKAISDSKKGNKWERDGKINYMTNLEAWRIERAND